MDAMFDGYESQGPAYDEMFDGATLRPPYQRLRNSLQTMTTPISWGGSRHFRRAIWTTIERGVQQRVLALEAFLADVYDAGQVFDDGVIPYVRSWRRRRTITASRPATTWSRRVSEPGSRTRPIVCSGGCGRSWSTAHSATS